jgi:hypothetical protein
LRNSREQTRISRDTEIRQLRAYSVVDSPAAILSPATNLPVEVRYLPNNVGQTPAKDVIYFARAFLAKSRLEAFNLPPFDTSQIPNHGPDVLLPSSQFKDAGYNPVKINPPITQEEWDERRKFIQSRLIAFGEVVYKDVFDIERHTWWCYMAGGSTSTVGPDAGRNMLTSPWERCLGEPGKLPPNRFD